jgi:DNA-binding NarL/FixJ family response regulator
LEGIGVVISTRRIKVVLVPMKSSSALEPQDLSKPRIRLMIVDDHPVFSLVLSELLDRTGDFVVVGVAKDGAEALELLAKVPAEIVLVDLMMPGISGLEFLGALRRTGRDVKTVVYSGMASPESMVAAFTLGVSAFIDKATSVEELLASLRAVARGDVPLSAESSAALHMALRQRTAQKDLSESDLIVLRRLGQRCRVKEIGDELGMTVSGVYKARTRIMERLGATDEIDLIRAANNLGLLVETDRREAKGTNHP